MWSKSLEVLNPYEATQTAITKANNQRPKHKTIRTILATILRNPKQHT